MKKMTMVRTIITNVTSQNCSLCQMNFKSSFIYGDVKEYIYMKPPLGLFLSHTSDVYKLKQYLYGFKQASRAWFDKFHSSLLQFYFDQRKYNSLSI